MKNILIFITTIIHFTYGNAQSGFEKYLGKDVTSGYRISHFPINIDDKELSERLKEKRFNNVTIHITEFDNHREKVALINSHKHVTSIELASNWRDTAFTNIPKFRNLENIDFVYIDGKMNLNYDSLWSELLKMPSLKFLGINNIGKNMVGSPDLDALLAKMEGIYINQPLITRFFKLYKSKSDSGI